MGSGITITGGSTRVSSEALRAARATLAAIGNELDDVDHALRPALALATGAGASTLTSVGMASSGMGSSVTASAGMAATGMPAGSASETVGSTGPAAARLANAAAHGIRTAAADSHRLADELGTAADLYDDADRRAGAGIADLSTISGWALGTLAPLMAAIGIASLPSLLLALTTLFAAGRQAPQAARVVLSGLGELAESRAFLLRDPRVVSLIRFAVSAADDAMLGALGLPLNLVASVDDRGDGAFGLHGAATLVVGAGAALGLLKDTPVHVRRASSAAVAPPTGFADLAARVPPTRADAPQVRVERYSDAAGESTYIVYVGGTVDTSPVATGEPFDITSDLIGVAQGDPASLRTTEEAMAQAGVKPGDTVIPVGYSQGGIVATSIATSGDYDIPALVTFGSPTAGIDVADGTVDVAVEHTDDLVPALGGEPRADDAHGGDRIVVTRQTFTGEIPAGSSPIDAHLMKEYALTAQKMDASSDARLSAALATLPHGGAGDAGLYQGTRVHLAGPNVPHASGGGGAW
ncbi:hypothetical protein [Humibacter albus]|uniref:hypothetical protein n=1 Tax=Humibacter albus TaxID=427754 RepID=UPI0003B6BF10|nr:hypothetical protein [Humibacter albus]